MIRLKEATFLSATLQAEPGLLAHRLAGNQIPSPPNRGSFSGSRAWPGAFHCFHLDNDISQRCGFRRTQN
jgi:hypothetical protein